MSNRYVNLMTSESRCRCLIRRHVARWGRVVLLLAMLSGVCWWSVQDDLKDAEVRLAQLNQRAELFRTQLATNAKAREKMKQAQHRRELFERLASPHEPLQLVGIVSASSREQDGRIRVDSFSVRLVESQPYPARPVAAKQQVNSESGTPEIQRHSLVIAGVADDDQSLSQFITALRKANVFVDVELKSSSEVLLATTPVRKYQVHCAF